MKIFGKEIRARKRSAPDIETIEVNSKHFTLRVVIFVVLLAFGVSALIYGLSGLFSGQSGWQTIAAESSDNTDCSSDFSLIYEIGVGKVSAKTEYNSISKLYESAASEAYKLFHESQLFDDIHNVAYINAHPNEMIEVDEVLYDAFQKLDLSGKRQLFLAPIYEYYEVLFSCTEEWDARDYDPFENEGLSALFSEISGYINDPDAVSLELSDGNHVCLRVSDEYLRFAEEKDIFTFCGFNFMKNAFIIDYLADVLEQNGYTRGSISSYDGFCRNLDSREINYAFNIFDRVGNNILQAGTMNYTGRRSIVSLRTFPVSDSDDECYYVTSEGETRFPYIDMRDGLCRASVNDLACYSDDAGCADILLEMLPVYIADTFDPASLLSADGIEFIFCRDGVIWHSEESLKLSNVIGADVGGYDVKLYS